MSKKKLDVVYFHSVTASGVDDRIRIKVGYTGDHNKRLSQHSSPKHGIEFQVQEICALRGTRDDEQHVLKYFKDDLLGTEKEVFWPTARIKNYLRWLRDQWYVWVPDCDMGLSIEDMEHVESTIWMPGESRTKREPDGCLFCGEFGELKLPPRETTIDDFYTSEEIIEPVRRTLGRIDLDPASHAIANTKVKARRFYSKNDNGLERQWSGTVWVNPPFSTWSEWTPKVVSEWASGRVEAMCILCATRTLTAQYFHPIHTESTAICILRGRIPFWGDRAKTPDDGHAVFYFGNDADKFVDEMSAIGTVYINSNTGVLEMANA